MKKVILSLILFFSEALDKAISEHDFSTNNTLAESGDSTQRTLGLVETSRPPIGDLIDLSNFDRSKNKVYASVAEMKRSKVSSRDKNCNLKIPS